MTTLFIILIVLTFIGIFITAYKTFESFLEAGFLSLITSFGVFFISLLVLVGLGQINLQEVKSNVSGVTYIKNLSANSQTSGDFFLGCGKIEEEQYYFYMAEAEFGCQIYKMKMKSNVYIKEDNPIKPYIEYVQYKCTHLNWFVSLFLKPSTFDNDEKYIIFHLPKNSIVNKYNVDVSNL